MLLIDERCVACRNDAPRVTDQEIAELHPMIPSWDLVTVDDTTQAGPFLPARQFHGSTGAHQTGCRFG